ncbi:MAG: hypothetical protein QM808_11645 [Steroidobacteraceae bacterium]
MIFIAHSSQAKEDPCVLIVGTESVLLISEIMAKDFFEQSKAWKLQLTELPVKAAMNRFGCIYISFLRGPGLEQKT